MKVPADGGTKLTTDGEWHVKVAGVGKPLAGMLVKEHEGALECLPFLAHAAYRRAGIVDGPVATCSS